MFEALALARGDGRYARLMKTYARVDLLILDDWGISTLNQAQRVNLLEKLCALLCQEAGRGFADAAAGAGDGDDLAGYAGRPAHQATTPASSKKPPFGPSSDRVARRTPAAAPCSGVRCS